MPSKKSVKKRSKKKSKKAKRTARKTKKSSKGSKKSKRGSKKSTKSKKSSKSKKSRKKSRSSKRSRKRSSRSKKNPKAPIHVYTDFDNTMVPVNTAGLMVRFYLRKNPHHEPLGRRMKRAMLLAIPELRRKYFSTYYEVLRRIPSRERHHILRDVHVSTKMAACYKGDTNEA